MHYVIMSAVADERRDSLLHEAESMRLARIARPAPQHHGSRPARLARAPLIAFRAWLARGYL